jgi:predicted DNA-binding transcriptional regulator
MFGNKEIYQDRYEGYVTTLEGPKKSIEELEKVAEKIKRGR